MDKKSEQRKDHKECGDTDIGVHDYGAGGCREQMAGLWSIVGKEVTGLPPTRIMTGCYGKEHDKDKKPSLLDEILDHGPPLLNTSKPHRVF